MERQKAIEEAEEQLSPTEKDLLGKSVDKLDTQLRSAQTVEGANTAVEALDDIN